MNPEKIREEAEDLSDSKLAKLIASYRSMPQTDEVKATLEVLQDEQSTR